MPLRATRAAVPAISARIGVPTSQSGLPLKSDFAKNPGPNAVHANVSGPTLKFLHVIGFMVFAFCPALLLPLVVFWLAGYQLEDNFLSAVFYDDQNTFTTTTMKNSPNHLSEDEESFVYPASEVTLNEVVEVTDPETDDEVFVYERMKEDLQRSPLRPIQVSMVRLCFGPFEDKRLESDGKTFYPEQQSPKSRSELSLLFDVSLPSVPPSSNPETKDLSIQFDPPMPRTTPSRLSDPIVNVDGKTDYLLGSRSNIWVIGLGPRLSRASYAYAYAHSSIWKDGIMLLFLLSVQFTSDSRMANLQNI
ncbi:hypothetical protein BDZ97DRAFT_1770702 [Flammula alnicola]|nr:hypothetical protein BDZ97DRAFT_1770702 [Flammula alnicola]